MANGDEKKTSSISDEDIRRVQEALQRESENPIPGTTKLPPFQGPAFGPEGDLQFTSGEIRGIREKGEFNQTGDFAIFPQGPGDSFLGGIPNAGAGGGGGGRAARFGVGSLESSSPEALRDRLIGLYEQWTGAFPDRPSLDFVTNQALGGESVFNIRGNVQATPEFKSRFKNMPAGMDIRTYDQALVQVNSQALKIAGRPVTDQELALYFAGDGKAVFESFKGGPPPGASKPPPAVEPATPPKTEQILAPNSKIELEEA